MLDVLWTRRSAPLGTLVRYADDFVVMCHTKAQRERGEARVKVILARPGLELHPDKTRRVELFDGREGFDFLGCHLRKRMSGTTWERERKPAVASEIRALIRRISTANPSWGSPRIVGDLARLGITVAKSTVEKQRVRPRKPAEAEEQEYPYIYVSLYTLDRCGC